MDSGHSFQLRREIRLATTNPAQGREKKEEGNSLAGGQESRPQMAFIKKRTFMSEKWGGGRGANYFYGWISKLIRKEEIKKNFEHQKIEGHMVHHREKKKEENEEHHLLNGL